MDNPADVILSAAMAQAMIGAKIIPISTSVFRWVRFGILAIWFVIGLRYITAMPIFENADEAEHFLYIHSLIEHRRLPLIEPASAMNIDVDRVDRWNNHVHHPPLYYAFGAAIISWTDRSDIRAYLKSNDLIFISGVREYNNNKWLHLPHPPDGQTAFAVSLLRALNLCIGALTLHFIYMLAKRTSRQPEMALAAMSFAAFIPMMLVISTSASNDSLLILLYSVGTYGALRLLHGNIDYITAALLVISAALAPLTKITGLTLYGVIGVAMLIALTRKQITFKAAVLWMGALIAVGATISGWWYVRNWQLYDDPLAQAAVQGMWGRPEVLPVFSAAFATDLTRIAKSFWLMLGYTHMPTYAPTAFYGYAAALVLLGIFGWTLRPHLLKLTDALLFVAAVLLIALMLLYGTRTVDISYGRLLFPALGAFAVLLTSGVWGILKRFTGLTLTPLIALSMWVGWQTIPMMYPTLEPVETLPSGTEHIKYRFEGLQVVAFDTLREQISPEDNIPLDIYIRGTHRQNPALMITAVDPSTSERLGFASFYPGLAPTSELDPNQLYRTRIYLDLSVPKPTSNTQITLGFQWYIPETVQYLEPEPGQPVLFHIPIRVVPS